MLKPRYYQTEAENALFAHWAEGGGNSLLEMATGTGKSFVNASVAKRLLRDYPGIRILSVTHVKELIEQNCKEMLRLWPQAPVGIYSAGVGRRDARAQILFGGIQSIHDKSDILGAFDLILVDEVHLVPRKADTMYGRFLEANAKKTDHRLAGLSATLYRLDSGRLDAGEGAMFEKVVYSYGIDRGIKDAYLSPLVSKAGLAEIDTGGVHTRGGEFVAGELERAALEGSKVEQACAEMTELGRDRRAWLAFCTGVKHAHRVASMLENKGISTAVITGETPKTERARLIGEYRAGRIRCLASVGVLTTGFNVPGVDMVALLRPTLSAGLYIQMVGRGTRPVYAPGAPLETPEQRLEAIKASTKPDCLVLDFAGVIRKHGPVDAVQVSDREKRGKNGGAAIVATHKTCPQCQAPVALAASRCQQCGYAFPRAQEDKHEGEADASAAILKSGAKPIIRKVSDWSFHQHEKPGGTASLRIDYRCGMHIHSEWLCFDHGDIPRARAVMVWHELGGARPYPQSVSDGLERAGELQMPDKIEVKQEGRFFRVVRRTYAASVYAQPA